MKFAVEALVASVCLTLPLVVAHAADKPPSLGEFYRLDSVSRLSDEASKQLIKSFGGPGFEAFERLVKDRLGEGTLVGACIGSFSALGERQVAFAYLSSAGDRLGFYVSDAGNGSSGPPILNAIASAPVRQESAVAQDVPPLVRCESKTALSRIVKQFEAGGTGQQATGLKKRTDLDAVCIPNGDLVPGYTCFDLVRRRWERIGGWAGSD